MENNRISALKYLRDAHNPLLKGLPDPQIAQLAQIASTVNVAAGDTIIQEGEISDDVFIIQSGAVNVIKREKDSGTQFQLATLASGESIGEVSLLDNEPRSASVIAIEDSILLKIKMMDLNSIASEHESAASRIKVNFAREMAKRLRKTNETTVSILHGQLEEARARVAMGTVICWLLVGICLYILVLQSMTALGDAVASTTVISVSILFVFGLMTLIAAKRSGYPLSFYGLNIKNWRRVVGEALLYSIPLLLLIGLLKWLLIAYHPKLIDSPLLDWSHNLAISRWQLVVDIALYTLFTPVQEFIARGGVQSSFQSFLTDKRKNLYAILIANLMFSMTHIHLSTVFAILVFLPGLFWGWMYYRQQSLLGVCLSHILIGLVAYYVIGFQALL